MLSVNRKGCEFNTRKKNDRIRAWKHKICKNKGIPGDPPRRENGNPRFCPERGTWYSELNPVGRNPPGAAEGG